jgi:lysozyme family protein
MSTVNFANLKSEYEDLFESCRIRPERAASVKRLADKIMANESRYRIAQAMTSVPWSVVALIHCLEASLDFNKHLHNGDPLTAKTVRVPAGRPPGNPPFDWEESAADALRFDGLSVWTNWSVPGVLFMLEKFNGFGSRNRGINSPYLWSFSGHYTKGKFVADHVFDPEAVSGQCGAAVLLKELSARGADLGLDFEPDEEPGGTIEVPVGEGHQPAAGVRPMYPGRIVKIGETDADVVRPLQLRLDELGCGELSGTGFFGTKTETAVKIFQARFPDVDGRPLVVDGQVGSITWAALFGADTVPDNETTETRLLSKVMDIAVSQIGVLEQPTGSNGGEQVDKYLRAVGLDPGFAWCVAFQYWCFERAAEELGVANPMIKTAGVLDHWNQAGRKNIPRIAMREAADNPGLVKPGMIFTIDTGSPGGLGHAGFVERVSGGRLVTVEGNTNRDGSREGIGVFRRDGRKINTINKGFIDYGSF